MGVCRNRLKGAVYMSKKRYDQQSAEYWKEVFIKEYKTILPRSCEDYNSKREKGTPQWQYIARRHGIERWLEWMKYCEVVKEKPKRMLRIVHRSAPSVDLMIELKQKILEGIASSPMIAKAYEGFDLDARHDMSWFTDQVTEREVSW